MKHTARWVSLLLLVLLLGAWGAYQYFGSQAPAESTGTPVAAGDKKQARKPLNVNAMVVKPAPIVEKINSAGTLMPDEAVDLSFESSGRIVQLNIDEGKRVSKGTLLAKINDNELQAQLAKLKIQLKLAEDREQRQRTLLAREAISQESYEQANTEMQTLKADIMQLEAKIEKSSIVAPFDGMVGLRYTSEGAFVSPGMAVAQMVKISPLKVDFAVPERYAGIIKPGMPVYFRIDGVVKPFEAKVYAIQPQIDSKTRTQTIRAMYSNTSGALTPGRYVSVELHIHLYSNAIAIPSEALVPEMDGAKVYVYRGGQAKPIMVQTGIRTESEVQITKGLSAGDTLITSGILQLRTNLPVTLDQIINNE